MLIIDAFKAFFNTLKGQKPDSYEPLKRLQEKSRLIDFFKEDISSYSDEEVGAAVRQIHKDAAKALEDELSIRPLFVENEGAIVTIEPGFNPFHIKLVGNVLGSGPYEGTLMHKGWKSDKNEVVLYPAEIEVK